MEEIKAAGCAGLIIPDLPPEATDELRKLAADLEIVLIFLVAPTSKDQRIKDAAKVSTGFLYAVSLKGVTGVRNNLPPELPEFIRRVKSLSERPVAVGFGIATPEQARLVAGPADGVIVGSAIVRLIAENPDLDKVESLVKGLREAI